MDKLKQISDAIKNWIKNNPKQATVVAIFIAGFLLGAILF